MSLQPDHFLSCLDRHAELGKARRFVVAYSGGLDSTVLLDLSRRALAARPDTSLLAVHVNHNLQASSKTWSEHCAATAQRFGVDYVSCEVSVSTKNGESPEAAARNARYTALAAHIAPGDVLLNAHHRDDQIETVLLQLMRGAGVAGLAGMPELAAFAGGWCLRPLLTVARSVLLAYAQQYQLEWTEDPSNTDRRYDRNFLRHEILPALNDRWPGAPASVARSARHCATAAHLMREIGAADVEFITATGNTVDLQLLAALSALRVDNALRCWLQREQLPIPSTAHMEQIRKLLHTSETAGCVSWPGAELRRYRNRLYAMSPLPQAPVGFEAQLLADSTVTLPARLGSLTAVATSAGGLDPQRCGRSLTVRFRAGGEKLCPTGGAHRRELSNLYQEAGVVPWMRDRIPLLYAGDRLAAVAGLWLEQELSAEQGVRALGVSWENHPSLY